MQLTPLLGSLDGAKESGAAGLGSSGNPDTGGGGNATFLQDDGHGASRMAMMGISGATTA